MWKKKKSPNPLLGDIHPQFTACSSILYHKSKHNDKRTHDQMENLVQAFGETDNWQIKLRQMYM